MSNGFIAIDWGSTNLRAWRYENGACVDSVRSEAGVTRLGGRTPQQVFGELMARWQRPLPVVMAGMIGSNAGWLQAPYLPCPSPLTGLARQAIAVEQALPYRAWIIPGICVNGEDNCNVMRGEETQLLGAHTELPSPLYVMPGTHSKWVQMDGDTLVDFRTVMTGELHHLLLSQSLIGVGLGEQRPDAQVFERGLAAGLGERHLVRRLFETRAAHLLGKLEKSAVSDWLSGLLIGNEVAQMQQQYPLAAHTALTVIGNPTLAQRYGRAFDMAGIRYRTLDGDRAFQTGIRSIANELED
ncbi:2-dehydro-3-deoxygalactonokinase [Serratia odorifera]|uniref:2-dehydro-3-deoxygalactonokinase n=2 Tax=Serratia odorifera TaxID=618 RepID=D4DZM3_SEROD|nr:2-dehydro-3-deoxygalactonokinase [Serratia odorifera]EFE96994.1 2-dehydro-3-deoxygalactonokinase [Serratia odorifera DSM 4582]MBJ2066177.1 2-dehydro-3-deoxygalactonokinase [Serratia odorifera]PNK91514.1 2-oxo-3-deoxygalactonate kinase [Serratia odorifera]RII72396.1 2-dehydro-3-deoxygalactonokinase [Serratia odorifera]VDZ55499.1 2-keto-3-deoxy-galactonokinase [Serratia odorifera]